MSVFPPHTPRSSWQAAPVGEASSPPPVVHVRLPQARRAISKRFKGVLLIAVLLLGGLGCLGLGAGAVFYGYYQLEGRIVPGVSAAGVDLGGMTLAEAQQALQTAWGEGAVILVSNAHLSIALRPAELGLSLDEIATAQRAYQVGHGGSLLAQVAQLLVSAMEGWTVSPVIQLDETTARRALETHLPELTQPPQEATVRFDGERLQAVPATLGYTVNIEATLQALAERPAEVLQRGKLVVVPQPLPASLQDATPLLAQAERLLETPVILSAYDPIADEQHRWTIERALLGEWLTVATTPQGPRLALDKAKVDAYLEHKGRELGSGRYLALQEEEALLAEHLLKQPVLPLRVRYHPTAYTVRPGDTLLKIAWKLGMPPWRILQANPGLDPDRLPSGATLTIPSKDDLLPLPPVPNKRIIILLKQQRLRVYQDGQLIAQHVISTGIDRSPTQPGVFQVLSHVPNAYASVWDLYMPNFLGIYEAWPGFMNGIHGLPTLSNGRRLWANVLGRPASYGCIILDLPASAWLYRWAENGVVVEIRP